MFQRFLKNIGEAAPGLALVTLVFATAHDLGIFAAINVRLIGVMSATDYIASAIPIFPVAIFFIVLQYVTHRESVMQAVQENYRFSRSEYKQLLRVAISLFIIAVFGILFGAVALFSPIDSIMYPTIAFLTVIGQTLFAMRFLSARVFASILLLAAALFMFGTGFVNTKFRMLLPPGSTIQIEGKSLPCSLLLTGSYGIICGLDFQRAFLVSWNNVERFDITPSSRKGIFYYSPYNLIRRCDVTYPEPGVADFKC